MAVRWIVWVVCLSKVLTDLASQQPAYTSMLVLFNAGFRRRTIKPDFVHGFRLDKHRLRYVGQDFARCGTIVSAGDVAPAMCSLRLPLHPSNPNNNSYPTCPYSSSALDPYTSLLIVSISTHQLQGVPSLRDLLHAPGSRASSTVCSHETPCVVLPSGSDFAGPGALTTLIQLSTLVVITRG